MFNENEHWNVENAVIRSSGKFFLNSDCLFIEFNDIMQFPMYRYLQVISWSKKMEDILNLAKLDGLDDAMMLYWYFNRKNQNILKDLLKVLMYDDDVDRFIYDQMAKPELNGLYTLDIDSFSVNAFITKLVTEKFNTSIKVYYPVDNVNIRNMLTAIWKDKVEFVYGDLVSIIKELPIDTTYIFSDITKINAVIEADHLNFSSIGIPIEFKYNYEGEKLKIDIDQLGKEYTFKFNQINAVRD